jgi:hypothetical protein
MFNFLKAMDKRGSSGLRKQAVRPRGPRPELELFEDRIVLSPISDKYTALGGAQGLLGPAVSGELPTPYGGGLYQEYQNGAIFWSASTGAHDIYGPIASKFFETANETDAYGNVVEGILGLPTNDETSLSGVLGALTATFQGGYIDWSAATGAHTIYGAIGAEYAYTANEMTYQTKPVFLFLNGLNGHVVRGTITEPTSVQVVLGAPTSDEMSVPGVAGARMNTFRGGDIYWSPSTGAHVVYGAIGAKYDSLGGPAAYGLPTSDEADAPGVPGVRVQQFHDGDYYAGLIEWSAATGAHTVYGAIGAEYMALANETDYYGTDVQTILAAPTSDEMDVPGVAGARMNTFQGGEIYFSPGTGAHVVYGGINQLYSWSMGGPTSYLGLPTSDEEGVPSGRVSYFQGGKIVWTPGGGAYPVQAVSQMTFDTNEFNFGSGFFDPPVQGWAELTVYADGGYHFTGHFHDSGFLSYRDNIAFGLLGTSGYLYTFVHSGYMSGTLGGGSRDDNWDVTGSDPRLAANWADLEGCNWYWQANVNADLGPLVNQLEQAAGIVLGVIGIIVA